MKIFHRQDFTERAQSHLSCDECGSHAGRSWVELGEERPDEHERVWVCSECLRKAIALAEANTIVDLPIEDVRPKLYVHITRHSDYYFAVNRESIVYWNGRALGPLYNVFWEALQRHQLEGFPTTPEAARFHFPVSSEYAVIEEAMTHD